MSIASGPAAEITEWFQAQPGVAPPVHFWCIDGDAEALQYSEKRCACQCFCRFCPEIAC